MQSTTPNRRCGQTLIAGTVLLFGLIGILAVMVGVGWWLMNGLPYWRTVVGVIVSVAVPPLLLNATFRLSENERQTLMIVPLAILIGLASFGVWSLLP